MRVRNVLIITAILSSALAAVVVYLVLTVPNDVQASALLQKARTEMAGGQNGEARQSLAKIVQQYPRTDAAAAATVALVTMADQERQQLQKTVTTLRQTSDAQQKQIAALNDRVQKIASTPPPAPPPAPAVKPAPAPAKTKAKKAPVHRAPKRRHR
jgi:predicted negative regulator of RcsB-dependent stress response